MLLICDFIPYDHSGFNTGTTSVSGGALSQYFDKYYDVAVTGHSSGLSLGITVMPLVTEMLLDIYGWRGTVLLLSGISAHGIACGALFKPITLYAPLSTSVETNAEDSRQKLTDYLKNYLDTRIFNNLTFLTCLSLFAGIGFYNTGWVIYVVPHVIEVGFAPYDASLVATIGGFANFIARVSHPLTDMMFSPKVQLYISTFIMASSFAFDVLASSYVSYVGLVACSVGFGTGNGIMVTAVYPILNAAIDDDQMINAVGWMYGIYGLASILSGFSCGKLISRYC